MDLRSLLNNYSIVIIQNNQVVFKSQDSGISPLLKAIDLFKPEKLYGSLVADKVVGKAAALLFALFRPRYVFSMMISKPAVKVLRKHSIEFNYDKLVDYILNRDKTDLCPFEKAVSQIDDPIKADRAIKETLEKLKKSSQ